MFLCVILIYYNSSFADYSLFHIAVTYHINSITQIGLLIILTVVSVADIFIVFIYSFVITKTFCQFNENFQRIQNYLFGVYVAGALFFCHYADGILGRVNRRIRGAINIGMMDLDIFYQSRLFMALLELRQKLRTITLPRVYIGYTYRLSVRKKCKL